jgi:hypothetical protein
MNEIEDPPFFFPSRQQARNRGSKTGRATQKSILGPSDRRIALQVSQWHARAVTEWPHGEPGSLVVLGPIQLRQSASIGS